MSRGILTSEMTTKRRFPVERRASDDAWMRCSRL